MARQHTLSGDWLTAAQEYKRAYEDETDHDLEVLFDISAGLLLGGHVQQHRELLGVLLDRHARTEDARVAYLVARLAVLADDQPLDPRTQRLAEFAVEFDEQTPWYLHSLGLVCLRELDLDRARILLTKSAESNWEANVSNMIALAIVYHRLDDVEKADQYWQKAQAGLTNLAALHPHDRVAVKILLDEAEALLGN
jgi:tetratricopeptide (TPR) repeat protein